MYTHDLGGRKKFERNGVQNNGHRGGYISSNNGHRGGYSNGRGGGGGSRGRGGGGHNGKPNFNNNRHKPYGR